MMFAMKLRNKKWKQMKNKKSKKTLIKQSADSNSIKRGIKIRIFPFLEDKNFESYFFTYFQRILSYLCSFYS